MSFKLGPGARSFGTKLIAFDSIGSTNAEALNAARAGERGPLWFATTQQTAGRGRRSRSWSSPRGNLAASILETLTVQPAVAATLGFAAGLALEAALQRVSVETVTRSGANLKFALKWPNDVLAGGKKISGILLEAEAIGNEMAVVTGMGVNVVSFPEGTPYPATSLDALGIHVGAEDLFTVLSDTWTEFRGIWDDGRGFAEIRRLWLDRAAGLGEAVSIRLGSATIHGVFETIDDAGCMVVKTAEGRTTAVAAGDVYFGAVRSAGAA